MLSPHAEVLILLLIPIFQQWALSLRAAIRGSQGYAAEARALAEQAVRTCELLGNFSYRGTEVRLVLAQALEAAGDRDTARQCIFDSAQRIDSFSSNFIERIRHDAITEASAMVVSILPLLRDVTRGYLQCAWICKDQVAPRDST